MQKQVGGRRIIENLITFIEFHVITGGDMSHPNEPPCLVPWIVILSGTMLLEEAEEIGPGRIVARFDSRLGQQGTELQTRGRP